MHFLAGKSVKSTAEASADFKYLAGKFYFINKIWLIRKNAVKNPRIQIFSGKFVYRVAIKSYFYSSLCIIYPRRMKKEHQLYDSHVLKIKFFSDWWHQFFKIAVFWFGVTKYGIFPITWPTLISPRLHEFKQKSNDISLKPPSIFGPYSILSPNYPFQ